MMFVSFNNSCNYPGVHANKYIYIYIYIYIYVDGVKSKMGVIKVRTVQ
jgi:hypothetical protein